MGLSVMRQAPMMFTRIAAACIGLMVVSCAGVPSQNRCASSLVNDPGKMTPLDYLEFVGLSNGATIAEVQAVYGKPERVWGDDELYSVQYLNGALEIVLRPPEHEVFILRLTNRYALSVTNVCESPRTRFLGQPSAAVVEAFGRPVRLDGNHFKYPMYFEETRGASVHFVCYEFEDNVCSQIEVIWSQRAEPRPPHNNPLNRTEL